VFLLFLNTGEYPNMAHEKLIRLKTGRHATPLYWIRCQFVSAMYTAPFNKGYPLPYLTLPYGEDVLPPSAEASNRPNAHPRINHKVTKSPSAILTWVHINT